MIVIRSAQDTVPGEKINTYKMVVISGYFKVS